MKTPTWISWLRGFNTFVFFWTDGLIRIATALFWLLLLALGIYFYFVGEFYWWIIYIPGLVLFVGQASDLNPAYRFTRVKHRQYINNLLAKKGIMFEAHNQEVLAYWRLHRWRLEKAWSNGVLTVVLQAIVFSCFVLSFGYVFHVWPWIELNSEGHMNPKLWKTMVSLFAGSLVLLGYWGKQWENTDELKKKKHDGRKS